MKVKLMVDSTADMTTQVAVAFFVAEEKERSALGKIVKFHNFFPSRYFYKKNIENNANLLYNYYVVFDSNPTAA